MEPGLAAAGCGLYAVAILFQREIREVDMKSKAPPCLAKTARQGRGTLKVFFD